MSVLILMSPVMFLQAGRLIEAKNDTGFVVLVVGIVILAAGIVEQILKCKNETAI